MSSSAYTAQPSMNAPLPNTARIGVDASCAVRVHQLQRVPGHRLVHGQVVQHVPVVLAVVRRDALLASSPRGVGETANSVGSGAGSSGPDALQYAPATPRSISGISMTSIGSS